MKKIFILCLILFLTGCSAEYNITINSGGIKESLEVNETDTSLWDEEVSNYSITYRTMIQNNLKRKTSVFKDQQLGDTQDPIDAYEYYKKTEINDVDKLGIKYEHKFSIEDYSRSYLARSCYEYVQLYDNSGVITISTSKEFKCIENYANLDSIKINITTKYKVLDNNATSVDGYTYTWTINKENYSDKNIYIKVNTKEQAEKLPEEIEKEEKILKIFVTIGIILIVFAVVFVLFLISKRKKLEND